MATSIQDQRSIKLFNEFGDLRDVPVRHRSRQVCEVAIALDGEQLEFVPRKLRTASLCRKAVNRNVHALAYVPVALRTKALCDVAMHEDSFTALRHIPLKHLNIEQAAQVLKEFNTAVLGGLPQKMRNVLIKRLLEDPMTDRLIPRVPDLDTKVNDAVEGGRRLHMSYWHLGANGHHNRGTDHSCDTAHCRAGWAIILTGDEALIKLEHRIGVGLLGALIYYKATKNVPDFFTGDVTALKDIQACAARAAKCARN